ncbi:MAG: preprotein translocase subunit YajC [Terracoccus sp.]
MEAVILILPLLLLGWLFLTSSRRQKQVRAFAAALNVGDKIVTSSGMFGTIRHMDDSSAWLEVAEGVTIRVDRRAVAMKQTETPSAVTEAHTSEPIADDSNGEGPFGNRAAGL